MAGADGAVHAVGGDHQVGVQVRAAVGDGVAEAQVHPDLAGALAQHAQEHGLGDGGEAVAEGADARPADADLDGVPAGGGGVDAVVADAVGRGELPQGRGGEDHAEPEGVAGGVALVHHDLVPRVGLLEQQRGVEAARAAADARDPHAAQRISSP